MQNCRSLREMVHLGKMWVERGWIRKAMKNVVVKATKRVRGIRTLIGQSLYIQIGQIRRAMAHQGSLVNLQTISQTVQAQTLVK